MLRRRRLAAQAERIERSAHLEGQANTYSGIEASNRAAQMAQAEQYVQQQQDRAVTSSGNRAAQMAQAEGYVKQLQDRADSTSSGTDSDDDFLPGSHHVSGR